MKNSRYIFIGTIVLLIIINAGLLYQSKRFRDAALDEVATRQLTEQCLFEGISNIGTKIPLDSISRGHHFILRYDQTTCMTCLIEAEALLENVFGREEIIKELCLIGVEGTQTQFDNIVSSTSCDSILTPMDTIYSPYFCYINDNGDTLFSLTLQPENYEFNRKILIKLRPIS